MHHSKKKEPFFIGVAGGIASGKSSVCRKIINEINLINHTQTNKQILIISMDSFYKKLSDEDLQRAEKGEINLDHPESFDEELAYRTLMSINEGKTVQIPVYDKKSYRNTDNIITITADTVPEVIIFEGILVFYYPKIRDLCNLKLFVDCDADTRLSRRVQRDMEEYKRPLDHILGVYQKFVKPAFEEFCLPTKKYADVIIPRGAENNVAINLIVQHINDYLNSAASHKLAYAEGCSPISIAVTNSSIISGQRSPISIQTGLNGSSSSGSLIISGQSSPNTPSKRTETSSRPH
jgi:uridine kinase